MPDDSTPSNVHIDHEWRDGRRIYVVSVWVAGERHAMEFTNPSEAFSAATQALLSMTLGKEEG